MEHNGLIQNKLYFSLWCSWLGLFLIQVILSFANVRGNAAVYILAVLNAIVVAAVAGIGYVKKERLMLLVPAVYALVQVVLFVLSIPAMVTGTHGIPKFLQCLFFIPGYGLGAGSYGWRWAFLIYWSIILYGAWEGLGMELKADFSGWWEKSAAPWLRGRRRPKK